jgi:hypothetical protein
MSGLRRRINMKIVRVKTLGRRVVAVATLGAVGDWSAYVDAVPGKNHEAEADDVAGRGDKLPQDLAEFLFPDLAKEYEWRE